MSELLGFTNPKYPPGISNTNPTSTVILSPGGKVNPKGVLRSKPADPSVFFEVVVGLARIAWH